jgi:hypothetical protein
MSCKRKIRYRTYGEALDALIERVGDPLRGSAYECGACGTWHISSRRFTLNKTRGRGGMRRGIVKGHRR